MSELITWLRAQLDEDERVACEATNGPWAAMRQRPDRAVYCVQAAGALNGIPAMAISHREDAEHIARHDPARVLAEVAAKRALIERGDTLFCECDQGDSPPADPETGWTVELPHHFDCTAYRIAQVLAQPYAGREGWRDEWRVE